MSSPLQRGEYAYTQLMCCLDEMVRMGAYESTATLRGELERSLAPAEHQIQLVLSKTTYYRRRREAVQALIGLLTRAEHPTQSVLKK